MSKKMVSLHFTAGPSISSHERRCDGCGETIPAMTVHDCGIAPPPVEVEVTMAGFDGRDYNMVFRADDIYKKQEPK